MYMDVIFGREGLTNYRSQHQLHRGNVNIRKHYIYIYIYIYSHEIKAFG